MKASSGPTATVDLDHWTTRPLEAHPLAENPNRFRLLNLPGTQKSPPVWINGWMLGDFQTSSNVTKWVHQPNETTIYKLDVAGSSAGNYTTIDYQGVYRVIIIHSSHVNCVRAFFGFSGDQVRFVGNLDDFRLDQTESKADY